MIYLVIIILAFSINSYSAEIIQDQHGNYYMVKKDGTFTKLPAPKPGNKYIIKKKTLPNKSKPKKTIFKKVEKKSRVKSNQGIR